MFKKAIFLILFVATMIVLTLILDSDPIKYLNKNNSILNLNELNNLNGLEVIKDDLDKSKLIVTGEVHGRTKDDLVKIKMVKYLKKERNLKYIIDEIGYCDSYLINKYLNTGNEKFLNEFFSNVQGTYYYNEDNYNFYVNLYEFNKTLDESEKIKVIGIDLEFSLSSSYTYIMNVIKDLNIKSKHFDNFIKDLEICTTRSGDMNQKIQNLNDSTYELINFLNEDKFKFNGNQNTKMEELLYVLNNIKITCESILDTDKSDVIRESRLYENFLTLTKNLENEILFGQFGSNHIYQNKFSNQNQNIDSFISKLNKTEEYKNKIISINYGYYQNEYMSKTDSSYLSVDLFDSFIKSKNDCIIFKLNSKNSPFNSKFIPIYNLKLENSINKKSTTDYFQYIILIKGIANSKPLKL